MQKSNVLLRACLVALRRHGFVVVLFLLSFWICVRLGGNSLGAWIAGFLLAAGIWLTLQGRTQAKDAAALGRLRNNLKPSDGDWTAVAGRAVALDESEGRYLAYRYQTYDRVRGRSDADGATRRSRLVLRFEGFFMRPFGVDTPSGCVRIRGLPDLSSYDGIKPDMDVITEARRNATLWPKYIPPPAARELAVSETVDGVNWHVRFGREEQGASGETKSWAIREGDEIVILGQWRSGALGDDGRRSGGLPTYSGSAEAVSMDLGDVSKGLRVLGIASIIVAIVVTGISMLLAA